MVIVILIVDLVIVSLVLAQSRSHVLTVRRVETVRSFYAADAGVNLAIREVILNRDEDGDGGIGSISADGDASNDPVLGGAPFSVTRVDGPDSAILTSVTSGAAHRAVQAEVTPGGGSMEWGSIVCDGTPRTFDLQQTYTNPIVVCMGNFQRNTRPFVVRVDNVTAATFDAWLQNPGDAFVPAGERVWFVAMEEGAWTFGGLACEAQRYESTVTDGAGRLSGEAQSYLQAYAQPVVVGQVMTANDRRWSTFWARGRKRQDPPDSARLWTGKHIGEDRWRIRARETVGFIVFESGRATVGAVPMDAILSDDAVRGHDNNPPFRVPFTTPFDLPAEVLVGSPAGHGGKDGHWVNGYGINPGAATHANVMLDEDQIKDRERKTKRERIGLLSFERSGNVRGGTISLVGWAETDPH